MRCPTLTELPPPPTGKTGWPWTEESSQLPDTMPNGRPWPRVSIVTPSYSQGQFIEETIRSVLLQGYPDLEHIIIDGGSTDGSVDVIRKYEPWLEYWVSEHDKGQAEAINKGWRIARGEYLGWLNSDDALKIGAISKVVAEFQSNDGVDMVYGDNEYVREDGTPFWVYQGEQISFSEMLRTIHTPIPQPGSMIRRDVLRKVGYLDQRWHVVLDREFFIRIAFSCRIHYVPYVLAEFRIHQASKTKSGRKYWAVELPKMYREFYDKNMHSKDATRFRNETMGNAYYAAAKHSAECGTNFFIPWLRSAYYLKRKIKQKEFRKLLWLYLNKRSDSILFSTIVYLLRNIKQKIVRIRLYYLR